MWPHCVGLCTAAAAVIAGNKGLQALITYSASEALWTHCMMHLESLAMKGLCPELSEVMVTVIKTVNYIKICPLKNRLSQKNVRKCGHSNQSFPFQCILIRCHRKCGLCSQLSRRISTVFRRIKPSTC